MLELEIPNILGLCKLFFVSISHENFKVQKSSKGYTYLRQCILFVGKAIIKMHIVEVIHERIQTIIVTIVTKISLFRRISH